VIGEDRSDSLFTIQSSVALLSLAASLSGAGAELSWSTDPGVGPGGLAGYRLYRVARGESGNGARIGPELIVESRYRDRDGAPGDVYRLVGVNGLREELELGGGAGNGATGLALWPAGGQEECAHRLRGTARERGALASDLTVRLYDVCGGWPLLRGQPAARGAVSITWPMGFWPGLYFVRAAAPSAGFLVERKLVVLP
jgi:hypothetical protein